MKKKIKLLFIVMALCLLIVALAFSLAACNKHQHTYIYDNDNDWHWQVCAGCGASTEKEPHTVEQWNEVTPATYDYAGEAEGVCTVCDGKVTKVLPKLTLSVNDQISESLFEFVYHSATTEEDAYYEITRYIGDATEVAIPSTFKDIPVKEINFSNTSSWNNVEAFIVEDSNPTFQSQSGVLYKKEDKTFVYAPKKIKGEVEILDGTNEIPSGAFSDCDGITKITIPDSVTDIGQEAFYDCDQIEQIIVPQNVTHVGQLAFGHIDNLSNIEWHATECEVDNYNYNGKNYGVFYGSGEWLAAAHFMNGMMVSITANVERIDDYTFAGLDIYGIYFGNYPKSELKSIGEYAFAYCHTLIDVNKMPSNIEVADTAFYDSTTLRDRLNGIDPANLQEIGEGLWFDTSNPVVYRLVAYTLNAAEAIYRLPSADSDKRLQGRLYDIDSYALAYSKHAVIVIPGCVRNTQSNAFLGCTGKQVRPEEGESIVEQDGIVYQCDAEGVASILYTPFNLSGDIKLLDGLTSIPGGQFYGCENITSITIPDSVTSIGSSAFFGCTGLTEITIPDSVTRIGQNAFSGCTSLQTVTIGSGVTSIGDGAFSGCTGLTEITIPNSVTSISYGAFRGCRGLTEITIPGSVQSIGYYAFDGCTGITKVNVTSLKSWCEIKFADNSANPLYEANTGTAKLYLKDVLVTEVKGLDGLTQIPSAAFYGLTDITSVTIPDSVQSIGSLAFSECIHLQTVIISEGVQSIGDSAFKGCTGLTEIMIPNSVQSIGNSAFYDCTNLKTITGGNGLTYIDGISSFADTAWYEAQPDGLVYVGKVLYKYKGTMPQGTVIDDIKQDTIAIAERAFSGCTGLTEITIPGSVQSICDHAFYDCRGLQTVTIGEGVTSIGSDAFRNCTGLIGITISNSVTSIGDGAFSGCTGLQTVTIGEGVTSIGSGAFRNCTGLIGITISNSVTSIGDHAFYDCRGLQTVTIGKGVQSIGESAFYNCTDLQTVNWNATNCKKANYRSYFYGCTKLTIINIGDTVKYIPEYAFSECINLQTVIIGEGVQSIGDRAFSGCTGLQTVIIGEGVQSIGNYAFHGCTGLQTVYYEGTRDQWNDISIGSNSGYIVNPDRYYFSAQDPYATQTAKEGEQYWHWNEETHTPEVWAKEN